MRLDIFLPHRPADKASALRRLLARLGPSWVQSPVRRLVQALSLALFLTLFFYVVWPYGSPHYAEAREAKEIVDAETFLRLDPLVAISAAVASRALVSSLVWAGVLLAVTLVIPRGFCGYLCPLGTVIDLSDWLAGRRVKRFRLERRGWWVHLKYYVLAGVMTAAVFGVLLSGFVSAMPVLTRGMLYIFAPLQTGFLKGFRHVPPVNAGQIVSILLLVLILALGFLSPRFWCRHVCPTGAVLSLVGLARLTERKVTTDCIECGKCIEACPFDAIRGNFTARRADCTFCQTCGGACPSGAITFTGRWSPVETRTAKTPRPPRRQDRQDAKTPWRPGATRRGFIGGVVGGLAAAAATRFVFGAPYDQLPVRPPGSVPEEMFLARCVRCGECVKACPGGVLQPMSFQQGLDGLWTPRADCDRAGCDPECNNCGHVCPTGAIRPLPLVEKRAARMGLAYVNRATCLPHCGGAECTLCFDQCMAAGYKAIEFTRVHVEFDADGAPLEDTGYLAPVVLEERCVGCGLCQSRCYGVNVVEKRLLGASAIKVLAGAGREDRITTGSYLALREKRLESKARKEAPPARANDGGEEEPSGEVEYLPDFLR